MSALHVMAVLAVLSADTGRFTIYKLQHPVGAETYETTIENGVRTLAVQWAFRYIGSDVSLRETLTSAEDGTPIRLEARGQTSTLTDIDLLIEVVDGRGRIVERGKERMVARPARFFTASHYPPIAIEEALFRYWLSHGQPAALPLLPNGAVAFERRGRDTVGIGPTAVALNRYGVAGLVWGRQVM